MRRQELTAILMVWLSVLLGCGDGSDSAAPPAAIGEAPPSLTAPEPTWLARARMQFARQEVGVAALDGKVYVIGGFRQGGNPADTLEVYDIAADRWQFAPPLPLPLHHVAATAAAGKIYVLGGFTGAGEAVDLTVQYDPQADRWTLKAPLPTRRGALAAAVIAGDIYAVGGFRDGVSVSDLARYSPDLDRWEVLPAMPTPRDHLGVGVVKGRLYAVAGRNAASFTLSTLEEFTPTTRTWIARLPLPTPRSGVATGVVNDELLVFGGEGNVRDPRGVFQEVEAFDPSADRWRTLPPMPTPRHGIGAAVQANDIFIPGGGSVQGFGATDVHEVLRVPLLQ